MTSIHNHCKFLLNSFLLGLIKLQTYLSILGKKAILTFKNQLKGENVRSAVPTFVVAYMGNIIT
jgi:hypothetical protein